MDIFSMALRFLAAAAAGFFIMSLFGIRALVDLCSSIPLARRRKKQAPDFDLSMALRRIARRAVIGFVCVAVFTILAVWLTSTVGTFGFLLGMILAFLRNLNRMTPNNRRNQRQFDRMFADCYPQEDDWDFEE